MLDTNGSIGGAEGRVTAALDDLYERAGLQLFVVYVDSFSSAADAVA